MSKPFIEHRKGMRVAFKRDPELLYSYQANLATQFDSLNTAEANHLAKKVLMLIFGLREKEFQYSWEVKSRDVQTRSDVDSEDKLTKEEKEILSLATILWKDYQGKSEFDPNLSVAVSCIAKKLDFLEELTTMLPMVPVMTITPADDR